MERGRFTPTQTIEHDAFTGIFIRVLDNNAKARGRTRNRGLAADSDGGWCGPGGAVVGDGVPGVVDCGTEGGCGAGDGRDAAVGVDGGWCGPGGAVVGDGVPGVVDCGTEGGGVARYPQQVTV